MNKKEFGIYIHIPFCKRKCYYCDFVSYPDKINLAKEYINCIKKEINKFDFLNYNVTTIYIGGGTPSYIETKGIEEILKTLKESLRNIEEMEVTIEVNPGTVDRAKIRRYKEIGINRISIGLQETNNELLKQIGRIHNFEQFIETYKIVKEEGFSNINVDLMIGLPNQSIKDIKNSLEKIIKLNPQHISIYSLIVEEGTIMQKAIDEGKIELPDEDLERRMYWYVKNILELNGYNQYEISNFSKKGYESKHNLNCWNQEEYIGFGINAHSYIRNVRFSNTKILEEYIKNINNEEFEKNKQIEEVQTKEDEKKEFMMLGFRKIEGVSISKFKEKFVENPLFIYNEKLSKLAEEGLIEVDLDYIRLTPKGLDLANIVFEEFI